MDTTECAANFAPLTPISFLIRAASFFAQRTAVIYGDKQYSYREFSGRVDNLARALKAASIKTGERVAILAPNIPPMLEAHFAVPMIGAVLIPFNYQLDAKTLAELLDKSDAKLLLCDREFLDLACAALNVAGKDIPIVVIHDPAVGLPVDRDHTDYEAFLEICSGTNTRLELGSEHQPLSIQYTSGTTGKPKGVVYIHRGAYLAALSNALSFNLKDSCAYLWTWPMFHSNGLSFIWAVTAVGGVHICLRPNDPATIFSAIHQHHADHFSAPPNVLSRLVNWTSASKITFSHPVFCSTGGAPPPPSVIHRMQELGIEVVHQYGSTECYGPSTLNPLPTNWHDMTSEDKTAHSTLQGVPTVAVSDLIVADPTTLEPVARDGVQLGEILVRGNTVMASYHGDSDASDTVLSGGWYHSGDIAVWHEDGSIDVKDRSEDIIKCDGTIVSSIEIEDVLCSHPDVLEAAVVAKPAGARGHIPCAFVNLVEGRVLSDQMLFDYCRSRLEPAKVPGHFLLGEFPKTATGKTKKARLREIAETVS